MFVDWNNQYCENDYTTESNLQIQCNPDQTTNSIFHSTKTKKLENSAMTTGLEKISFLSNHKKGKVKECSNYCTIALIHRLAK